LRGRYRQPWKATTINPMLSYLESMLNELLKHGKIHYNLAALVDRLPASKVPMQTFTTVEVEKLLDTFAEDRLGHVWHLALVGLRARSCTWSTTCRWRSSRRGSGTPTPRSLCAPTYTTNRGSSPSRPRASRHGRGVRSLHRRGSDLLFRSSLPVRKSKAVLGQVFSCPRWAKSRFPPPGVTARNRVDGK
jgi:hypothetical protein